MSVTSTGRVIFANQPNDITSDNGSFRVTVHIGAPCGYSSCSLSEAQWWQRAVQLAVLRLQGPDDLLSHIHLPHERGVSGIGSA